MRGPVAGGKREGMAPARNPVGAGGWVHTQVLERAAGKLLLTLLDSLIDFVPMPLPGGGTTSAI